jgi:hypothetical protein
MFFVQLLEVLRTESLSMVIFHVGEGIEVLIKST